MAFDDYDKMTIGKNIARALVAKGYDAAHTIFVDEGRSAGIHLTARPQPGKDGETRHVMGRTEAELLGEIALWPRAGARPSKGG